MSESLTATTGKRSLLFFSIDLSLITPVVVSSIEPMTGISDLSVKSRVTKSAPSSIVMSGFVSKTELRCLKNSSFDTPCTACTSTSFSAR